MKKKDAKWKIYENTVASLKSKYRDSKVQLNKRIKGRRSGVKRQVDVWVSADVSGATIKIAVECRCYEKEPIGIKDVDAFYGFLDDVGANKGVMISNSGFTKGAKKRADGAIIELTPLTLEDAEQFDWAEYVTDACQISGCWGNIQWNEMICAEGGSMEPPPYKAGFCDSCGSFHLRCGNCGTTKAYEQESDVQCDGCEVRWKLRFDRKGLFDSVEQLD